MLYWLCTKSAMEPNLPQMKHAIARNFGGSEMVDVLQVFLSKIGPKTQPTVYEQVFTKMSFN